MMIAVAGLQTVHSMIIGNLGAIIAAIILQIQHGIAGRIKPPAKQTIQFCRTEAKQNMIQIIQLVIK